MSDWQDIEDDAGDWEPADPIGELETRVDSLDCDMEELADRLSMTQGIMFVLFGALTAVVVLIAFMI